MAFGNTSGPLILSGVVGDCWFCGGEHFPKKRVNVVESKPFDKVISIELFCSFVPSNVGTNVHGQIHAIFFVPNFADETELAIHETKLLAIHEIKQPIEKQPIEKAAVYNFRSFTLKKLPLSLSQSHFV